MEFAGGMTEWEALRRYEKFRGFGPVFDANYAAKPIYGVFA